MQAAPPEKERRPDASPTPPTTCPCSPNASDSASPSAASTAARSRSATPDGADLGATEAAHALLLSGASLLSADYADAFVFAALARAGEIEAAACLAGDPPRSSSPPRSPRSSSAPRSGRRSSPAARIVSPSAINRATLSWYELSHLRRRELLDGRLRHAGGPAPVRLGERAALGAALGGAQTVPPPVLVRPRKKL